MNTLAERINNKYRFIIKHIETNYRNKTKYLILRADASFILVKINLRIKVKNQK